MEDFHAIILASGRSDRMGREKASLPWLDGQSLLEWTSKSLGHAGWNPLSVVRPENLGFWRQRLPEDAVIANPAPERGKASSLIAGLAAIPPSASRILITAVDQPRPPELYRNLHEQGHSHPGLILVPDQEGRRGHPVVLSGSFKKDLLQIQDEEQGLRGFLDRHRHLTHRLPLCEEAWLRWDLNTPAAYEDAFFFFSRRLKPVTQETAEAQTLPLS